MNAPPESTSAVQQQSSTSRSRSRRVLILAVVSALLVAGVVTGWYEIRTVAPASKSSLVRDDGPNLYQALAGLNSTVTGQTGGPWNLFSYMGIAAQQPYSSNVKGYVAENASTPIIGCQAALNGLTMFNGTIPTFNGTFNSGTAPFWQFAFYSNTSKEVLVGTSVLGTPRLYPPFPLQSNCTHAWSDFGTDPSEWTGQIETNGSLPVNSPTAAEVVWNNIDTEFVNSNTPLVELFTSGPAMISATQDLPWGIVGVDFVGCGQIGITGYGLAYYSGTTRGGQYAGQFNATTNCELTSEQGSYQVQFTNPIESAGSNVLWALTTMFVNATETGYGTLPDEWGLANWKLNFTLSTGTGTDLPMGTPVCSAWVSSTTDCGANDTGWYLVLLSGSGKWLDSYGSTGSGLAWTVPVVAVVSHEQLLIVVPGSWGLSGDSLRVDSTLSTMTASGSLVI
jgi:hypothetical protein